MMFRVTKGGEVIATAQTYEGAVIADVYYDDGTPSQVQRQEGEGGPWLTIVPRSTPGPETKGA